MIDRLIADPVWATVIRMIVAPWIVFHVCDVVTAIFKTISHRTDTAMLDRVYDALSKMTLLMAWLVILKVFFHISITDYFQSGFFRQPGIPAGLVFWGFVAVVTFCGYLGDKILEKKNNVDTIGASNINGED